MGKISIIVALGFCLTILSMHCSAYAQNAPESLNAKQTAMARIGAFIAKGNADKVKESLNYGLDSGLTVNETKEIIIQMVSYAGYPRALNAATIFLEVVKDRTAKGIQDVIGREATLPIIKEDSKKYEQGERVQMVLINSPVPMEKGEVYQFIPTIDVFLKEHLFADTFGRDNLDILSREITTVGALGALDGVNMMLTFHFNAAINVGLTEEQARGLVEVMRKDVGEMNGQNASQVLDTVLANRRGEPALVQDSATKIHFPEIANGIIFPRGDLNRLIQYFVGTSYYHQMTTEGAAVGNVTFEPGCRNNWHMHHKEGQTLLVTGGRGWVQLDGQPALELHAGDVFFVPPEVRHWHGAAKDSWFSHLSVMIPTTEADAHSWFEPVSDEDYEKLK